MDVLREEAARIIRGGSFFFCRVGTFHYRKICPHARPSARPRSFIRQPIKQQERGRRSRHQSRRHRRNLQQDLCEDRPAAYHEIPSQKISKRLQSSQRNKPHDIVKQMYSADIFSAEHKAILTPKNDAAFDINDKLLYKLPGPAKTYYSADTIKCDDSAEAEHFPIEFINSVTPSGMPRHKLQLKTNAIIMLLRNLDIKQGLCNGTRLRVCHLYNNVIDAEVLTTKKCVLIPRVRLAPSDTNLPFQLQRYQFPIRVAYCMTINKSQGY